MTSVNRMSRGLAVTWLLLGAGCNTVTGASEYEDVPRCTGPLCGACSAGKSWDPAQEVCVDDAVWCSQRGGIWDEDHCFPKGTCPSGERWYAENESCVPACGERTSECGLSCCEFGLYCVPDTSGSLLCSMCPAVDRVCGKMCCEAEATCADGVCTAPWGAAEQSCEGGSMCVDGESCCVSLEVPGGTFPMGSLESNQDAYADEFPEHAASVSSYRLDKYEVTVGRFRAFVDAWSGEAPPGGAGAHPKVPGSGWRSVWNERLPANSEELKSLLVTCGDTSTWLASDDTLPINCVSWFEAFMFCAWDGGRLATEAEWEYAAVGGDQDREYPWGTELPTDEHAVYQCAYGGTPLECYPDDIATVGTKPLGQGRWGHLDLAGNMYEWVLDVFDIYTDDACDDCANAADVPVRGVRGGSWPNDKTGFLRGAFRNSAAPGYRDEDVGIRCVRAAD